MDSILSQNEPSDDPGTIHLRKFCSSRVNPTRPDGTPNPTFCANSPRCGHHWFYDFRVNLKRYRSGTETDNKQQAKAIEARERSRVLEGLHQIRRLPDVGFREFAAAYVRDHAEQNKRSVQRDREIVKVFDRAFGAALLRDITAHRIEQFKRERLAGRWRGHNHTHSRPIRPATVNRELDTLRSLFSKAIEWGKLHDHPMAKVRRLKVDNVRTRILTEAEQLALFAACPPKVGRLVRLALITGARIGELLGLTWADVSEREVPSDEPVSRRTT